MGGLVMKTIRLAGLVTATMVFLLGPPAAAQLPLPGLPVAVGVPHATFAPGDVFVSLETGQEQWRKPDGTPKATIVGVEQGSSAKDSTSDAARHLYVTNILTTAQ